MRGTIAYVIKQFRESTEYAALSANTRKDYDYCADVAAEYITKSGQPLTDMHVDRLTTPAMQKVNETLAKGKAESRPGARDAIPARPSKAAHLLRFLRRLFDWGRRHGHWHGLKHRGINIDAMHTACMSHVSAVIISVQCVSRALPSLPS